MTVTKKITRTQLSEAIGRMVARTILEAKDSGVGKYATKVDALVADTIDSIDKLVKEGEELAQDNTEHDYAVQERNHAIADRVGILKALKVKLVQLTEDLYRKF